MCGIMQALVQVRTFLQDLRYIYIVIGQWPVLPVVSSVASLGTSLRNKLFGLCPYSGTWFLRLKLNDWHLFLSWPHLISHHIPRECWTGNYMYSAYFILICPPYTRKYTRTKASWFKPWDSWNFSPMQHFAQMTQTLGVNVSSVETARRH